MTDVAPEGSGGDWQTGLCGCFSNCGICIFSFILPCIQAGRNARAVDKSCCMYGCFTFIPIFNLYTLTKIRGEIREKSGIPGTCCKDLLFSWFCGPCTLAQEGNQTKDWSQSQSMARS